MLVISIFGGKIKLKMTKKVHDNLLEKYKNSVFQILKICKAFSNFDFNILFWNQKTCPSQNEFYQLITERENSGYRIRP